MSKAKQVPVLSLYVHIPFCRRKCAYCDFASYPYSSAAMEAYVQKLCREIADYRERAGLQALNTVYIGGGTPSLVPEHLLENLFEQIRDAFDVLEDCEITLEANPGTFARREAEVWRRLGVNRVSLGVQALDDELLQRIGRIHTEGQAEAAVRTVQDAGIRNVNLDLIYGLPGQTLPAWEDTLRKALALGPTHVSAYQLINEENTRLRYQLLEGKLPALPDEDTALAMEERAADLLEGSGLRRYEVSNYALPGFECRHNITYWQCLPYLGIGCAAHSDLFGRRYGHTPSLSGYLEEEIPARLEEAYGTDRQERAFERVMLGFRMTRGVDLGRFRSDFGTGPEALWPESYAYFEREGYARTDADHWALTDAGMRIMNTLLVRLLSEAERKGGG